MNKKIVYMFVGIITCFCFMGDVFAVNFRMTAVPSTTEVVEGSEVSIMLKIETTETGNGVSSCNFKLTPSTGLGTPTVNGANDWTSMTGTITNITGDGIVASNSGMSVAAIKVNVNANGSLVISDIVCGDGDTESEQSDITLNFTTKAVSQDTSLSNITVTGGTIQGTFSSTKKTYSISLSSTTFGLTLTASNSEFQDRIVVKGVDSTGQPGETLTANNITFSDSSGQNMMMLFVIVNGDEDNKYTLTAINNTSVLSNSLKTLSVGGKNITLTAGKYDYSVVLPSTTTEYEVKATIDDSENFEFGTGFTGSKIYNSFDDVVIEVNPKSSSNGGTKATYIIKVTKEGASSSPSGSSTNPTPSTDTISNPQTGSISTFVIAVILFASLILSVAVYKKNLESYK